MKKILLAIIGIALVSSALFAGEIATGSGGRFDIVSRTSFGIDLDNPYRFGLKNELTRFALVLNLVPYQKASNRVNSDDAVGFIDFTLFHLDLVKSGGNTPNQGGDAYNAPGAIGTNRYQTGEFVAGIVKGPWLIQLNAGGNEPFLSPWNKGLQFVNDGIKLSWAYLDSMVDVVRDKPISSMKPLISMGEELTDGAGTTTSTNSVVNQFQQDGMGNPGSGDDFAMGGAKYNQGHLIAVMYNRETFGINLKLATEKAFDDSTITKDNMNGLAVGIDSVFNPSALPGLKIFASAAGKTMYGLDKNPDDIMAGTKIGYEIFLNEDVSVQPYVGLDFGTSLKNNGGTENTMYEASVGAVMRWPGQGGWLTDYLRDSDGRVWPGMALAYKIFDYTDTSVDPKHSIKFTLFEPKGDDGMFFGLGAEAIVDFINIGEDKAQLMATVYVDYTLPGFMGIPGAFIPWAIICYDNLPGTGGDDRINDMKLDIGVKLENAISNTTFGIGWHSGSIIQQTQYHWGYIRATAEIRF